MTPVDALDTMILMGLKDEAGKTREYIATNLSFDKDIDVQNFEITIRLLGGLLSGYQMTGDKRAAAARRRFGKSAVARLRITDRLAISLRQSEDR